MYTYRAQVLKRYIDSGEYLLDIDLGFGIWKAQKMQLREIPHHFKAREWLVIESVKPAVGDYFIGVVKEYHGRKD